MNYLKPKANISVLDIGSNDGTFLSAIKKFSNATVLGVDPSKNVSKLAEKKVLILILNFST